MVDLCKLETAIKYVDRIASGHHPVENTPVEKEDVLNDLNVIRCMFFIKEVLEEVRRNGGIIGGKGARQNGASFPIEVLDEFEYKEDKSITHVLKQINDPVKNLKVKKISVMKVTVWLKEDGYLVEAKHRGNGQAKNVPTEKGEELGIYVREREFNGRVYQTVIYDENAQKYIVEKIRESLGG